MQLFASCLAPLLAATDSDLLQGFEAVRDKCRAEHGEASDSLGCEFGQNLIGEGPDPGVPSETRLKRNGVALGAKLERLGEQARRREAVRAVAEAVHVSDPRAAVLPREAVLSTPVGPPNLALGKTVQGDVRWIMAAAVLAAAEQPTLHDQILEAAQRSIIGIGTEERPTKAPKVRRPATGVMADTLVASLREPGSIREAIILGEAIRPYHRPSWR